MKFSIGCFGTLSLLAAGTPAMADPVTLTKPVPMTFRLDQNVQKLIIYQNAEAGNAQGPEPFAVQWTACLAKGPGPSVKISRVTHSKDEASMPIDDMAVIAPGECTSGTDLIFNDSDQASHKNFNAIQLEIDDSANHSPVRGRFSVQVALPGVYVPTLSTPAK